MYEKLLVLCVRSSLEYIVKFLLNKFESLFLITIIILWKVVKTATQRDFLYLDSEQVYFVEEKNNGRISESLVTHNLREEIEGLLQSIGLLILEDKLIVL